MVGQRARPVASHCSSTTQRSAGSTTPISLPASTAGRSRGVDTATRSEEHTSELQSLMRISYAVFCLKKKTKNQSIKDHPVRQTHSQSIRVEAGTPQTHAYTTIRLHHVSQ